MMSWEEIDNQPIPGWFDEVKFGIFIHWGIYSVPAWTEKGKYSEWYWKWLEDKNSETAEFHRKTYGISFRYQDFTPYFIAELFDPDFWAETFKKSGAGYVVLTSKHHDGFCLWPSRHSWNWNSVDVGPHRDLLGELTHSVRKQGLKMGFYYSFYEWYNPLYLRGADQYVDQHMLPQFKDVVERYQPAIIFADGEWDHSPEVWRSREFLSWLFSESSCPKDVVINDRWGKGCRSAHGGYYTTEYSHAGRGAGAVAHKWEECRGIGNSFGYNRNETYDDYMAGRDLVHLLIDIVSRGGNLLLNIGPTADGRIPVIMQERLADIGRWLAVNGEAIYGTRPFYQASGPNWVRYTAKDNGSAVYAICLQRLDRELKVMLADVAVKNVSLLGVTKPIKWKRTDDGEIRIEVPLIDMAFSHAYVFKLT